MEVLAPNPVGLAPKLVLVEKLPNAPAGAALVFRPRVGGPIPAERIFNYNYFQESKRIYLTGIP